MPGDGGEDPERHVRKYAREAIAARLPPLDLEAPLDRFLGVDLGKACLPAPVQAVVAPQMRAAAAEARERITAALSGRDL